MDFLLTLDTAEAEKNKMKLKAKPKGLTPREVLIIIIIWLKTVIIWLKTVCSRRRN